MNCVKIVCGHFPFSMRSLDETLLHNSVVKGKNRHGMHGELSLQQKKGSFSRQSKVIPQLSDWRGSHVSHIIQIDIK